MSPIIRQGSLRVHFYKAMHKKALHREAMDIGWMRNYCLALPHTTEVVQWGDNLVFKIGGKMYAVMNTEPAEHYIAFKCSEEDFAELCELEGIVPAPYMARMHWVAI